MKIQSTKLVFAGQTIFFNGAYRALEKSSSNTTEDRDKQRQAETENIAIWGKGGVVNAQPRHDLVSGKVVGLNQHHYGGTKTGLQPCVVSSSLLGSAWLATSKM